MAKSQDLIAAYYQSQFPTPAKSDSQSPRRPLHVSPAYNNNNLYKDAIITGFSESKMSLNMQTLFLGTSMKS